MPKQIIIAEQHKIAAVFSEDRVQELVVSTGNQQVGDIYLGTVENVISGIDAAFVNIGDAERNGFMHVTDLGPLRLRRSSGAITELLEPQQKVLVQVMKEPTGNKGPRLTGNITLPGRYLVLMPYGKGVNLSRRLKNEGERSRLRALAILIKPAGMGLLVRTEADGKGEEAIMEDLEYLQKQWEDIQQLVVATKPPALLNRDDDFIQRVLRDIYSADVNRIVVDSSADVKRVKQHLMNWSGGRSPEGVLIDHHRDRIPILEYFRVNAAIREALKPRVDLPSGGYIIIEPTEALTVIDVNSGSFTRSATSRETVLWTNNEAATEIARQLRLRNIGGVIVVDFIDMDSRRDQLVLLENFNKALHADKARPQIAQLSELGLVELTRKRQGQNIYELFGKECPTCNGLGLWVSLPGENKSIQESLEQSVIPAAAPLPVPKAPPIPKIEEEEEDEEFEFGEVGNQDLELLNHPSYQDSGNIGRRRRRRRPSEGDSLTRNKIRLSPTGGGNKTTDLEGDVSATSTETNDRYQNERYQSRFSRRDNYPTEKVAVEMTPIEQDVYALMGVSPLVRLDREIKDSKSIIISVRNKQETDSEDFSSDQLELIGNSSINSNESTVAVETQEDNDVIQEVIEEPENSLKTSDSKENENGFSDSSKSPTVDKRRRRRRSSAKES